MYSFCCEGLGSLMYREIDTENECVCCKFVGGYRGELKMNVTVFL
jgi:hypothetical protein